jgi:hypothetical protein
MFYVKEQMGYRSIQVTIDLNGTIPRMNLLQLAKQERDRLNKVIALLESDMTAAPVATTAAAKPAKKRNNGHQWTEAERKAMSVKQKAVWAAKKKSKKA